MKRALGLAMNASGYIFFGLAGLTILYPGWYLATHKCPIGGPDVDAFLQCHYAHQSVIFMAQAVAISQLFVGAMMKLIAVHFDKTGAGEATDATKG